MNIYVCMYVYVYMYIICYINQHIASIYEQ